MLFPPCIRICQKRKQAMKHKMIGCILCVFFSSFLWRGSGPAVLAQEVLTLDKALETVLKNNYSIRMLQNESQVARNDASAGNAGMLPQVSLGASDNFASNDTKQKFSN